MEFLKEILAGTKKYFLLDEVAKINVPICPELTVERILKQVNDHKEITRYLPRIDEKGKQYMERDFLFSIVNTIDRRFFKEALAEVNARRLRS
jgi:hypothetical protein